MCIRDRDISFLLFVARKYFVFLLTASSGRWSKGIDLHLQFFSLYFCLRFASLALFYSGMPIILLHCYSPLFITVSWITTFDDLPRRPSSFFLAVYLFPVFFCSSLIIHPLKVALPRKVFLGFCILVYLHGVSDFLVSSVYQLIYAGKPDSLSLNDFLFLLFDFKISQP